ncbi:hypothetical protein FUAX_36620 [Fulvitalea axinellae]|uniref:Cytochrome c domain-containing protein n=1 Tax=Fulvitalea axinellae TaxID=1182444 RepID=A0AAU9DJ75_9BACT|nr:hypothetical protein FUAX_36620 [Fulvitalea axinellae]
MKNLHQLLIIVFGLCLINACSSDAEDSDDDMPCDTPPPISVVSLNPTQGHDNGAILVEATGNNIRFSLNGSAAQTSKIFTGLKAGEYKVTGQLDQNCKSELSVTLADKTVPETKFATVIAPIIRQNCATSGCHGGGQSPTLNDYAQIKANGSKIRSAVMSGAMPKNGKLDEEDLLKMIHWIDGGMPEN